MPTLSEIVAEYDAMRAAGKTRRAANTAKALKQTANELRNQKARGGYTPEQVAALDAEIERLDPAE